MLEPTEEDVLPRGTEFLWLYLSPTPFWKEYDSFHNYRDRNYLFWRKGVKTDEQDVFILIQTSDHCYAVAHYRVMDGFNEWKRFYKLFDAAQYLKASAEEYDELYPEYMRIKDLAKQERKKMRKQQSSSTRKGE